MNSITLKAKGKINLTLDVIGKRENGYHDLEMIMQTINLHDTIKIRKTKAPGIRLNSNLPWLPTDERNIAYKAAKLFFEYTGIDGRVYINIYKRIPVSAGLAGGSTDAAAVLMGLNKIYHTNLSKKKLMEIGVKLGADVPFCIMRGTVLAEGIGEVLTPLKSMPYTHILLAKLPINVSTASVYKGLELDKIKTHPNTQDMIEAIKAEDMDYVIKNIMNILENVTIREYPKIQYIKEKMLQKGAENAMMSGSGPTVFGIFKTKEEAIKAANYFKFEEGLKEVHVTSTYYKR